MGLLKNDIFVCVDCETTGLEVEQDRLIEVAAVVFQDGKILDQYETLIDPEIDIPQSSTEIHHITNDMVVGKPKTKEALIPLIKLIKNHIIVGHGILFDITFIAKNAQKLSIPCSIESQTFIDTLRLARLYGESPVNSLEKLRQHFNIAAEGAHRAMNDVLVNIEVFRYLTKNFKTTNQILERLKKPILLKTMPLGKHKGRPFSDIPEEYLQWASHKDFDQDLLFSIRSELKRRKGLPRFNQSASPFKDL